MKVTFRWENFKEKKHAEYSLGTQEQVIMFLFIFAQGNQQSVNNEYDRLPLMRYPLESI